MAAASSRTTAGASCRLNAASATPAPGSAETGAGVGAASSQLAVAPKAASTLSMTTNSAAAGVTTRPNVNLLGIIISNLLCRLALRLSDERPQAHYAYPDRRAASTRQRPSRARQHEADARETQEVAPDAALGPFGAPGHQDAPRGIHFHEQGGKTRIEAGDRELETHREQPVPSRVPTHHPPDVAGSNGPDAGQQREEQARRGGRPVLVDVEMQEGEGKGAEEGGDRHVELAGDAREQPSAEDHLLHAGLQGEA